MNRLQVLVLCVGLAASAAGLNYLTMSPCERFWFAVRTSWEHHVLQPVFRGVALNNRGACLATPSGASLQRLDDAAAKMNALADRINARSR